MFCSGGLIVKTKLAKSMNSSRMVMHVRGFICRECIAIGNAAIGYVRSCCTGLRVAEATIRLNSTHQQSMWCYNSGGLYLDTPFTGNSLVSLHVASVALSDVQAAVK